MLSAPLQRQFAALHGAAFGWALHCTGRDREAALDVLQASYARILASRGQALDGEQLRPFLFGVIRNVAREEQRRASAESAARERHASEGATDGRVLDDPGSAASRSELREQIELALKSLSPRQRELMHLKFYQGFSIEQAAEILDIGVGSARTHYERGKETLRNRCASLARHLT